MKTKKGPDIGKSSKLVINIEGLRPRPTEMGLCLSNILNEFSKKHGFMWRYQPYYIDRIDEDLVKPCPIYGYVIKKKGFHKLFSKRVLILEITSMFFKQIRIYVRDETYIPLANELIESISKNIDNGINWDYTITLHFPVYTLWDRLTEEKNDNHMPRMQGRQ